VTHARWALLLALAAFLFWAPAIPEWLGRRPAPTCNPLMLLSLAGMGLAAIVLVSWPAWAVGRRRAAAPPTNFGDAPPRDRLGG
jgi:hypothetical protein